MRPICFVIPGDINQPTGGYGYDRRVLEHAAERGAKLTHLAIPGGYPFPTVDVLAETARRLGEAPDDCVLLIDGLAYGAMPPEIVRVLRQPIVELCHHPLALEPELPPELAAELAKNERDVMALARGVIVTGPLTGRIVAKDFGVAEKRIRVALPGTDPAPRARMSGGTELRILAVGSLIPRKGYDVLIEAMARLKDLPWRLDIIGSLAHAPATVEQLQRLIQRLHLEDRVHLLGAQPADAVAQAYDRADLFVLASHFEGYGMAVAEAMARGLPIVATMAGAVAETMEDRAGLKVPVNAIQPLADAIHEMITTPSKRLAFSDGSWHAGQQLPRHGDTVDAILAAIAEFVP